MSLIPGICTRCGATVSVKKGDTMMCPYCNTLLEVKKAIQIFNSTYKKINNATVENIYVPNMRNDFEIVGGVLKKYCGQSLEVIVPNGVVKIGKGAFRGLYVTSITLPNGVKEIGDHAFEETKITEFVMPDSVECVRESAFHNCSELKKITISDNLKYIELNAFNGCKSLEKLCFPSSLEKLGTNFCCLEDKEKPHMGGLGKLVDRCTNLKSIYLSGESVKKFEVCGIDFYEIDIYVDNKLLEYTDELIKKFPGAKGYYRYIQSEREKRQLEEKQRQEIEKRKRLEKQRQEIEREREYYISNNLCLYCGGTFRGIFVKRCVKCGREKNYKVLS